MPNETLHIQLLGDMVLRLGDEALPTLPPLEQSLLAYLLLHRDAPQSRQHLAYLLWPDTTDAQARSQLRKLLYRLRQDLPDAEAYLHADTQTVGWRTEAPFTLDVAGFEDALTEAAQEAEAGRRDAARRRAACAALERAVDLYRGDLLPGCYDDWIAPERARLSLDYLHALERLQVLLEEGRQYERALRTAQRLLRHDPLHEPGYRALMRLHALTGNRASALRAYHTCATTLQRELGVEPGPDTRQAYERLLHGAFLGAPASPGAPAVPAAQAVPQLAAAASPIAASMVGRRDEWDQLLDAWHEMVSGHALSAGRDVSAGGPRLALIEGEAGIGKTRLAGEFARWARWQGAATAAARCYAAEGGLAYAPVVEWLRARPLPPLEPVWQRELARLLPELQTKLLGPDLAPPGPMTEAWQRQRLFQALARAVLGDPPHIAGAPHIPAGPQPILLLVDDLQWCDGETLEWLHYLLRHDPGARLLALGTVRMEEVDEGGPLPAWLRAVRRTIEVTEVALGPLDEAETRSLAAGLVGGELDADLAACIYDETEGNPLYVVEIVRAGRLSDEPGPAYPPRGLPPRVQATIEGRLDRLSPAARDLAGLAATVGREFTYAVLEGASDLDPDALLGALDELWQRRIVREQGQAGYDFTHDKLREVAYAGLGRARRQVLHRRVAGALEALHAADLDPVSGQIAAHYERAAQPARAIPFHLRAAGAALRVYANGEAASHYERVLALLPPGQPGAAGSRVEALGGLGQVQLRLGQPAEAKAYLRQAIALDRPAIALGRETGLDPHRLARLYIWLGQALYAQSRYEEQARVGEEGLALLDDEIDPAEAALIHGASALGYPHLGDREKAREVWVRAAAYVETLPYAEEWGTIYQRIFTMHLRDKRVDEVRRWLQVLERKIAARPDERARGILHQRTEDLLAQEGDLGGAIAHLHQAVACADRTGDVVDRSFYRWRLGYRSLALGDLDSAQAYARAAFEFHLIIGGAFFVAWGHWLLGLIASCRGNEREAVEHLEQALPHAQEADRPGIAISCHQILGQMHLDRGDRRAALERYQLAAELCTPDLFRIWRAPEIWPYARVLTGVLSGLEEAYADPWAFRAYCNRFPRRESLRGSGDLAQLALGQWYLEPAAPVEGARLALDETFGGLPGDRSPPDDEPMDGWTWHDPYGDCRHALQEGLVIEAANGRDLWHVNWSAPRLIRPLSSVLANALAPNASGPDAPEHAQAPVPEAPFAPGVALQTVCTPAFEDRPAMGGLTIWIDRANYLRLDWGMGGPREIALTGCLEDQDAVYSRGRLPPEPVEGPTGTIERAWLRLEWADGQVRALCSADGQAWYIAGSVALPYDARAQVGVYACGNIDRGIYPGAYPEGTAIRFESFRCWALAT